MDGFERQFNRLLVDTFNNILKYEALYLRKSTSIPVTISAAHMLEAVGKLGGQATVGEIAARLGITMPTATVGLKKLVSRGLISKRACAADARKVFLALTEKGMLIDRAHRDFHKKLVLHISGQFEDTEKALLMKTVKKLNEFFRAKTQS